MSATNSHSEHRTGLPPPRASLLITFYKQLDYLKLVLASVERQTFSGFEVIIADDGSPPEIVEKLGEHCRYLPFPVTHVWQDDVGYRRSRVLNEAARVARADYLIIVDGDCLLHPRFIEEHHCHRDERHCLTGRRTNLSPAHSATLTAAKIRAGAMGGLLRRALLDSLAGRASRAEDGIYLRSDLLRRLRNRRPAGLLGGNMSLHRSNLLKVNGFDERYVSYGFEETDLELRLGIMGITPKSLKNIAIQYHLYHPSRSVATEMAANRALLESTRRNGSHYTQYGMIRDGRPGRIEHDEKHAVVRSFGTTSR